MTSLSTLLNSGSKVTGGFNNMSSASQPRASYFIPSFNTANSAYGAVFLDSEFNKISSGTHGPINGKTGSLENLSTDTQSQDSVFTGVSSSQGEQSTSSGYFLNGLWNSEYGCTLVRGSSRGEISTSAVPWPTTSQSIYSAEASTYVNSDHSRKDITVQLYNGVLTYTALRRPWSWRYGTGALPETVRRSKILTSVFPSGTQISNMFGSASYNAVRKELVVMAYNTTTTARFDVAIWKNVNWDATDVNVELLGTPDVLWNVVTPSWSVNNTESQRNIKPVLVDNGDIYYSVMHTSNNFQLYKIVRAAGDASGSVTSVGNSGLTTSYGKDQGDAYGQKAMSTRSGNMVITYVPYYYYACGLRSFVIDKRNSNWAVGRESTSSSAGMNPLKYRDDSFAFIQGGNYYSGNYSGIATMGFTSPNQTTGGAPVTNSTSWYLPLAPQPNTTNYIAVFQVWDYDLQTIPPAYSGRNA